MQESYDLVQRRHPGVTFVRENPGEFCDQLSSLVRAAAGKVAESEDVEGKEEEKEERFVLFAVDDMLFYRDFGLPSALRLLATGRLRLRVLGVLFCLDTLALVFLQPRKDVYSVVQIVWQLNPVEVPIWTFSLFDCRYLCCSCYCCCSRGCGCTAAAVYCSFTCHSTRITLKLYGKTRT